MGQIVFDCELEGRGINIWLKLPEKSEDTNEVLMKVWDGQCTSYIQLLLLFDSLLLCTVISIINVHIFLISSVTRQRAYIFICIHSQDTTFCHGMCGIFGWLVWFGFFYPSLCFPFSASQLFLALSSLSTFFSRTILYSFGNFSYFSFDLSKVSMFPMVNGEIHCQRL